MRKLYIVKEHRDFDDLIKTGHLLKNKTYIIYNKDNKLPYDRFGISVGKKLGNAVLRNKYKRKIRSILDIYRKDYNNSKDYIIILRERGLHLTFEKMKEELISLLLKGEDDESKK